MQSKHTTQSSNLLRRSALPALLALAPFASADLSLLKDEVKLSDLYPSPLNDDDEFGTSVTRIGDLNGDGFEDIVVGAPHDDTTNLNNGALHVIFLNADMEPLAVSIIPGGDPSELSLTFGRSVANLGDVNGDGVNDLAVGIINGIEILFMLPTGQPMSSTRISNGVGGFSGTTSDWFGDSVAALGDFNDDGVRDVLVGAPRDGDGGFWRGAVYLLGLNSDGTVKTQRKISALSPSFSGSLDDQDHFGSAVARLGDIDGDGVDDIAVGAEGDDDGANFAGAVWILRLNADGTVKSDTKISDTAGGFPGNLEASDAFGCSLARMGDINGDGTEDLAVGAYGDNGNGFNRGSVWFLFLQSDGTATEGFKYSSTNGIAGDIDSGDLFGSAVANIGDLDGDGVDEIAIGSHRDDDGGTDRGAVYLLSRAPQVSGHVSSAGCNLNTPGSLAMTGSPAVGETLEFAINNPLGTQNAGALPVLVASLNSAAAPCGVPLAGWHMNPGIATGELVALPPYLTTLYGTAWAGPGSPALIELEIPLSAAFIGLEFCVQGALYNLFPAPGTVATGLTRAVDITVGTCP